MSVRLPFAGLSRLLAALAFGTVLMTASSCNDCENGICYDETDDSDTCCHLILPLKCTYEVGFRDRNGNLAFETIDVIAPDHGVMFTAPSGFTSLDEISQSCVMCEDGDCP